MSRRTTDRRHYGSGAQGAVPTGRGGATAARRTEQRARAPARHRPEPLCGALDGCPVARVRACRYLSSALDKCRARPRSRLPPPYLCTRSTTACAPAAGPTVAGLAVAEPGCLERFTNVRRNGPRTTPASAPVECESEPAGLSRLVRRESEWGHVRGLSAWATSVTRLRRPNRVDCSGSARGRAVPR